VPTVTELQPVAPNPFRQTATLAFSLSRSGPVDLAIYSVDGRRVRSLLKDSRDAGSYRLVWNGMDDRGGQVHAGVYYARLVTAAGTYKRTVIYMK
jgi:flagellar hook assembly protein FlgD